MNGSSRRGLQAAMAVTCLVPLLAGGSGMLAGLHAFDPGADLSRGAAIATDSHVRYLSGLLFGIGVAFASCIPRIERQGGRMRLLTMLVATGGLARLLGVMLIGWPDAPMRFGLAMELVVTPILCFWQSRVARHASR